MIEKIISIKNIGRFRDYSPRGDVSFRKLNLLFAENGRGKTTLCAILRSLQTGQYEFIVERKTFGSNSPQSVKIRLDGNMVTFGKQSWTSSHPDIVIFDSVFVHNNIYAGDYVDHEHRKNLHHVIVGAQGVKLAKRIEELDSKIRESNTNIRKKKEGIAEKIPHGITFEDYLAWQPVEDIENRIQKKKTEIANHQRILEKSKEIQGKSLLSKIALPEFPADFITILSKQLTDITSDAEVRVKQQIASHNMGMQGQTWLSQGLGFVANDKCPFCGDELNTNELFAAYRSHFNTAYKELKKEVAQLSLRITSSIGDSAISDIQQVLSKNLTLTEFWKQFAEIVLPEFTFEDVRTKYATLRERALKLSQRKQQTPTEPILPAVDFQDALDVVMILQTSADSYNTTVDSCNAAIKEQKTAAWQEIDINSLKKELADLEAKKKRFDLVGVEACKEYQDIRNTKVEFEKEKNTAKQQLDQHCEQILQTYEHSINTYLDQFNTGFRITNSQHLYRGGTPSSKYQIQINNCEIDLGDSKTQPGTPCFKTTLSSGDRSALAFAFFLAAIKHDAEIKNKIIVLDDPFTSQDRFRRTCTKQLICQFTDIAKQVIVLSHDPHFLRLIWESYPKNKTKSLQMCRTGDNTVIGEWNIGVDTQSTYLKNYDTLLNFYREQKGVALDVVRTIRPFIEEMLRSHFPGHFQGNKWLGDFISKIRDAKNTDGLFHAKMDLSEIEAINDYSKKYHHDQNPNADAEFISEDELHGFVKRTLRLVGGG